MPTLIKRLQNKGSVEFAQGRFDNWCVYVTQPGAVRYAPLDTDYFARLHELGGIHGYPKIYTDFVRVYHVTTREISQEVLQLIDEISQGYGNDCAELEMWLTVLYAGMIAEENKQGAILKKRIKRLGMHQVLMEHMGAATAANFSKGKPWRELDVIMKERGF